MLGVPTSWRELKRDAVDRIPALHEVLKLADVVSPWTVGRYRNPNEVARHAETFWKPDIAWCREPVDWITSRSCFRGSVGTT